jgi:hypothetical protein
MSIALMNIATQITPSPHHRFCSTSTCAESGGANRMKSGTSMAAYPSGAPSRARAAVPANAADRPSLSPLGSGLRADFMSTDDHFHEEPPSDPVGHKFYDTWARQEEERAIS